MGMGNPDRCFLLLLGVILSSTLLVHAAERTRMIMQPHDQNCTREFNGTTIEVSCNFTETCNVTINGVFIPCNDSCFECPPGTFSNNDTGNTCNIGCKLGWCAHGSECDVCGPGSYANGTGNTNCTDCPVGHVSGDWGNPECKICSAGSIPNDGSTACSLCDAGSFNSHDGDTACLLCDPGKFAQNPGATKCDLCPGGTYNPDQGQLVCTDCGAGYYNPQLGMTSWAACLECPDGKYCPNGATEQPYQCPKGYFCEAGSSSPIACQTLYHSEAGSIKCEPAPSFYGLIGGLGAAAILTIAFVWRRVRRSRIEDQREQKMEIDRLIPKPEGPVYRGL